MRRSLGPGNDPGLQNRMADRTIPETLAYMPPVLWGRDRVSRDRNQANATERGNLTGGNWNGPGRLPFQHLLGPQERRRSQTNHQLEKVERICPAPSLQDGRDSHAKKDLLRQEDYMAKIDLKDAYFAVPISEPDRKSLRFRWNNQTYQFNCLPFGLSCAPWVFTKTTKAVAAVLREMGVRIIMYIDDMLIMAESETLLRDHVKGVVYLLENLGFVINLPKSSLEPKRIIDFLGFQIDSTSMELKLPGDKIKNIRGEARRILAADHVTALTLSRILGKMNAATKAICMAPLFYRQLQAELQQALSNSCQDYNTPIRLSPVAREELEWWNTHFTNWNGRSLIAKKPNLSLETDASLTGWGAVCRGIRTGGPWSREEQNLHINCLEMLAAFLAFKAFFREERSIHVLLKMDNTSAIAYINKKGGTVSPTLNRLNKEFWLW